MGLVEAIMKNIVNEEDSRLNTLKESEKFLQRMKQKEDYWECQKKSFEALKQVLHSHGKNVSKTQIQKLCGLDLKSMPDAREIIEEIKEIFPAAYLLQTDMEHFLIPIDDDKRNDKAEIEKYNTHSSNWKNMYDLQKQLEMNCKRVVEIENRIRAYDATKKEYEQTRLEISKIKNILSDLEYKEREIKWIRNGALNDLSTRIQGTKKLEYMIENHKGTVIRPPPGAEGQPCER
jgi:hypothetical protein